MKLRFESLPLIAENRVVFYFPFIAASGGEAAETADDQLARLETLFAGMVAAKREGGVDAGGAYRKVWRQLEADEANNKLSGDLYPIAGRILHGDPGNPASGRLGFVLDHVFANMLKPLFLARDKLKHAMPVKVEFDEGWVRLFGSGLGLLGVSVRLSDAFDAKSGLHADDFLGALHALSQPPTHGATTLDFANRYSRLGSDQALSPGCLVVVDESGPTLREVQPAEFAKLLKGATGGGAPKLYRCVRCAALDADAEPAGYELLLEQLSPFLGQLAESAATVAKGGRLIDAPADSRQQAAGVRAVAVAEKEGRVRYVALESMAPGKVGLIDELPARSTFADWLLALLPSMGSALRPAGELRASPEHRRPDKAAFVVARLYTYTAVRLDETATAESADIPACRELTYRLARRFDQNYTPAQDEIDDKVFAPFDTVYHSVATQGAALLVRNDGTDFLRNFLNRVFVTAYRPIAEICYHEYLYLLRMVQESALLPASPPDKAELAQLRELTLSLARFRLFFRFAKISHMSQHNQVLAIWREELGLNVIESDLARDVHEAERVLADDVQRTERQHKATREALWNKYAAAGVFAATYLFCSTLIDDSYKIACPSDRVAMELTQVENRIKSLSPTLDDVLEAKGLNKAPFVESFDQLCRTGLPDEPVSLKGKVLNPAVFDKDNWRLKFDSACSSMREVRQCTVDAPRTYRLWAVFLALCLSGLAVILAWWFKPTKGE